MKSFNRLKVPTFARDSISRVSRMTGAVERALCVRAVGIGVTVMSKILVLLRNVTRRAFIDI